MEKQLDAANFVWNDGGRSASGFVGYTGDCVARAVAIATGRAYRDIYELFKQEAGHSPREGMAEAVYGAYLAEHGWERHPGNEHSFDIHALPKGVVIVRIKHGWDERKRRGHLCCIIDHVVHDTWCAAENEYEVVAYWTHPSMCEGGSIPTVGPKRSVSHEQELNQAEFDKVLRRLRALDRTAKNEASTEAERRNALRAIQTMMLKNNLTREDIQQDDNADAVSFARISCWVNGSRMNSWESGLARYICHQVFTSVQYYLDSHQKRRMTVFYGPLADVRNAILLYRELLLTIAAMAKQKYGGYSRGSGASYCEGYVAGLPRSDSPVPESPESLVSQTALIQTRMLAIKNAAKSWLRDECGVTLWNSSKSLRAKFDPAAASQGKLDGASHKIDKPNTPARIGYTPPT